MVSPDVASASRMFKKKIALEDIDEEVDTSIGDESTNRPPPSVADETTAKPVPKRRRVNKPQVVTPDDKPSPSISAASVAAISAYTASTSNTEAAVDGEEEIMLPLEEPADDLVGLLTLAKADDMRAAKQREDADGDGASSEDKEAADTSATCEVAGEGEQPASHGQEAAATEDEEGDGEEASENVDICVTCKHWEPEMTLVLCDGCPRSFCLGCLSLEEAPEGDFQ